eukprot:403354466
MIAVDKNNNLQTHDLHKANQIIPLVPHLDLQQLDLIRQDTPSSKRSSRQVTEMLFDLRKCVCDKSTQVKPPKVQEIGTSTQIDVKDSMRSLFMQTALSQSSINLAQIIKVKQQQAILSHFKKSFMGQGQGILGQPQPKKQNNRRIRDQDSSEHEGEDEESSEEIIPAQLRRYMAFKRERSYTIFTDEEYIFLDGLNNEIDIFTIEDFRFIDTIHTGENNLICAHTQNGRYYFGCQNKNLFIHTGKFKKLAHIKLKQNAYSIIKLTKDLVILGERRGIIEILDYTQSKIIYEKQLEGVSHMIQLLLLDQSQNLITLATNNGLYFMNINIGESDQSIIDIYLQNERYFVDKHVRGMLNLDEQTNQLLVASLDGDNNIYMINREVQQIIKQVQFGCSLGSICIRKYITHNNQNHFILVRDEQGVSIVDFDQGRYKQILQSDNYMAPFPQQQMEVLDKSYEEDGLLQILLIEYDGRSSVLKRFELNENFLSAAIDIEINFN